MGGAHCGMSEAGETRGPMTPIRERKTDCRKIGCDLVWNRSSGKLGATYSGYALFWNYSIPRFTPSGGGFCPFPQHTTA